MIDFNKLERCDTFFSKLRGLMFSKRKNLLFDLGKETWFGSWVHTFFVFFPVKVYWLDYEKEIIDYKVIRPFWIGIPRTKARYIIEISKR